jgi:hypothetical protein
VRHSQQDAFDAVARARRSYLQDWHPILAAVEVAAGEWVMTGDVERRYGVIRLLQIGGELGYRAVTWAERSEDRQLIGYFRTFRAAAGATHRQWLSGMSPTGFAPEPWPTRRRA